MLPSPRSWTACPRKRTRYKKGATDSRFRFMEANMDGVKLTDADADLLLFFRRKKHASINEAERALPRAALSVGPRVLALSRPQIKLLDEDVIEIPGPIVPGRKGSGRYHITSKGEIALDDYLSEKRLKAKKERLSVLWAPIAVGLLAYLFAYALDHLFT